MSENYEQIANELKQWVIGTSKKKGEQVLSQPIVNAVPNESYIYDLKNTDQRKVLYDAHQTWGEHLGYSKDCSPNTVAKYARWFFTLSGNNNDPVLYGDPIAIGYGRDRKNDLYLRNKKRDYGFDVQFENDPVFEWQILGGKLGSPVKTHEFVALYNMKIKECVIHVERTVGCNIGTPGSKTWWDQALDIAWDQAKKRVYSYFGI